MMKPKFPAADLFTLNRDRLRKLLPNNSLAVLNANDILPTNADGTLALVQNADLFYLTGIRQEETMLVLAPDAYDANQREVLFLRQPNELMVTWEGHKLSKEQATAISGIKNVRWLSEFPAMFRTLMCESENIFLNTNEHHRATPEVETRDARFVKQVREQYPLHQYHRLARMMHQLRTVKSAFEIEAIREACRITGKGFRRVLKFLKPGVNEKEVEAEFAHEFIRNHAGFAYNPIVAGGANNCILHYNTNDLDCKKGDLLLLDVAAAIHGYNSDLTRTIPVGGRFSRRQKQVYNAVLRIFRHQCTAMKPGRTILDLRRECEEVTTKECVDLGLLKLSEIKKQSADNPAVRKYFMHGVSHPIGLDVHDVLYPSQKIQPGWVLTCEPGIYIKAEGFGIRLENNIHVTANGPEDLMADIPIEVEEIESLMNR